ncbi:MAG: SOS response-associated peptidase, partial [Candidatus Margulisbacteria bacterium]|nr:SOS response-associated peptidase [Candidatus Margulisiibacteriota bacterium]
LFLRFDIKDKIKLQSCYNVAPGQDMPVIINKGGSNTISVLKWGLIPSWARDSEKFKHGLINARIESLTEKPSFKNLLKANRCLIPANGFYEWKKEGKKRTPYFIHLSNNELLAFAGLYDGGTYTVITTAAKERVAGIHDRMPVILSKGIEQDWLKVENKDALNILQRCLANELITDRVSSEVNNTDFNIPEAIKSLE